MDWKVHAQSMVNRLKAGAILFVISQRNLMDLPRIWKENRKFATGIFASVWIIWELIATITAFCLPKTYMSAADVKIGAFNQDMDRSQIQFEAQVILSPAVLNEVMENLNLNESWGRKYFAGDMLKSSETLRILQMRLLAKPAKNAPLISIESFSDSPVEAAEIANSVAKAYEHFCEGGQRVLHADVFRKVELPEVSVQIVNWAQPDHRPYKPNIPICVFSGAIVSTIYGVIAAALAIGIRLFLQKFPAPKRVHSNDKNPHAPPIKSRY